MSLTRWLAVTAALAIAYGTTAYLSAYLRIPPSYSACIYPPAGIAVAFFLVYGWRVWPGVVVGAAVISAPLWNEGFTLGAIVTTALLSGFAVAQFAVARWLVLRYVSYPLTLIRGSDIAKFFAYAGPLACLVNSTASHAVLYLTGVIPASDLAFSWAAWWIGDVLGVLLVAPLVLIFIAEPRDIWRARRISVALPLAITLIAVFALFLRASLWETEQTVASVDRAAHAIEDELTKKMDRGNQLLYSVERFFAGSSQVERDEFAAFVRRAPQQHAALGSVFWLAAMPREGIDRAPPRDGVTKQLLVTYHSPAAEPVIGLDVLSNRRLTHLLDTPLEQGRIVWVAGTLQDPDAVQYAVSLLAVYQTESDPGRSALMGYVGAEWSVNELLLHALDDAARAHARVTLTLTEDSNASPSATYTSPNFATNSLTEPLIRSTAMEVNSLGLELKYSASTTWIGGQRSWYAWTLLTGGLIFAVLLCSMLLMTSGYTARVQGVVDERTAELTRTNKILDTVTRAQTDFITEIDTQRLFDRLLSRLLEVSNSAYGFIGEVHFKMDGKPFLRTRAITNIAWSEETRRFYEENARQGLEFTNMSTLFGAAIVSGQPVISNSPKNDPRGAGTPAGHPPLNAFLGLPFHKGRDIIGMVGLANRPGGYDEELVAHIQPVLTTMANIIDAHRMARRRDESEHIIRESESRMRAILDNAMDSIITIGTDGRIESVNPATLRLFGYAENEIVGQDVAILMGEPYRSSHGNYVAAYLNSDRQRLIGVPREFDAIRKDGKTLPIEIALSEIRVGRKRLFTAIIHDLTERKKVEKMKNEFISTVSHELRTPLTSIIGSLGLVLGGAIQGIPEQGRQMIEIAKKNADRLVRLINDILDIEKIESGKMEFRVERQPLLPLIQQAVESTEGFAHKFGVGVRVVATPTQDVDVSVDGERIIQVINNLVSNAIKFSPAHGEVEIKVAAFSKTVRVSVTDHGPGIPEEFQGRIFQKFAQADSSDTRKHAGTGLGLSISKAIVERLGGRVNFETTLGHGSTFYFDLPLAATAANKSEATPV